MRRRQRSWISAFGSGLTWAAFGALLGYGYHLAIAPPRSGEPADLASVETLPNFAGSAFRAASAQIAADPHQSGAPGTGTLSVQERTRRLAESEAKAVLAKGIERELLRVGCLTGPADGRWSDQTQRAMQRFVDNVQAALPTNAPDYVLLTMLQGSPDRSCDRTSKDGTRIGAFAPRTVATAVPILAMPMKVVPPPGQPSSAMATDASTPGQGNWRVVVQAAPTTTTGEFRATQTTSLVTSNLPLAVPRLSTSSILLGRMAVGAPLPPEPMPGAQRGQNTHNGTAETTAGNRDVVTRAPARPVSRERTAKRVERPARVRKSPRLQNTFTALSRSAP